MDPDGTGRGRALAALRRLGGTSRLFDLLLVTEFTVVSFGFIIPGSPRSWAVDATAYWTAANRWLAGDDPYVASAGDLLFAAPPPTLAVLAPFATLPLPVFAAILLVGSLLAAAYLIRRLRLPFWFVLFPPLVEAVIVGNPNVIVVALLVAAVPAADALATLLKLYAIVPIAVLGRRRSIAWVAGALVVTAPLLPWATYLGQAAGVLEALDVQSSSGRSALAVPVLIPFAVVALITLGRRRAAWLLVPALWPATQFHYSVLALPASSRLMAAVLALPVTGAPAVAVIMGAMIQAARRARARAGAPE